MISPDYGKERWKYIEGYEGLYMVSDRGRVKGVERYIKYSNGKVYHIKEKIMKLYTNKLGYKRVNLSKGNKQKKYSVHRLVAEAFVPNLTGGKIINHKDENPSNNLYINLEWVSYSYNNQYNNLNNKRFKTRSERIKTGEIKLGHQIVCLNNRYNFIKEYTNAEWTREDGFTPSGVRSSVKRQKVKTYKKYYWLYKDEYCDLLNLVPQELWNDFLDLYLSVGNEYKANKLDRIKSISLFLKEIEYSK